MTTIWSIMSLWLLPLSIFIMLTLMVPLPLSFEKTRLNLINLIFKLKLPNNFIIFPGAKLFMSVLVLSGVMCLCQFVGLQYRIPNPYLNGQICQKAGRWRAERNFWISAMTFSMYFMTWRYYALKTKLLVNNNCKN